MGFKTLEESERTKLEKQLEAHEQANPQPVLKLTDGSEMPAEHTPQMQGETKSDESADES